MYKAGIIGCGWIAIEAPDNHFDAYKQCPNTELVAFCDVDMRKLHRRGYTNHMKMVKEVEFDIVSVCTPVGTHCQIVCNIAPYVKAIYCEKPMATTLEECDKMIEACEQNNVILQINHQRRFAVPKMRFSRDLIDTGTHTFDLLRSLFGEVECMDGKYWQFGKRWIEIEYVDTKEHIFELDVTCNAQRMILAGVRNLVACLRDDFQPISSGHDGREALRLALEFKEEYERNRRNP